MLAALEISDATEVLCADRARTGIFSDFDGTLSPIVSRPEDAFPVEGALEALEALARSFALVSIVSARSLEDLRARAKAKGVLLAGAYGRERSDRGIRRATEGWETVAIAASAATRQLAGVHVERKGTGIALHFRAAPEQNEPVAELADVLATEFGLEVRRGRMVYELIVPGPGKGEAIASLVAERSLERAFVAGDDVADVEAFAMLRSRGIETVIAAVASAEAPPGLDDHADLVFDGPDGLARFLRSLAERA